ncbi:MAG TPA: CBS domain-containing protein, partial [Kofleriaceae bacterium]|nr:CBS domain-containing protein [Kofleriaceae bacterium]
MKAGELCTRRVVTADPDEPITVCALRMEEYGVGDLIVVERSGETVRPIGIVTDRDLAIRGLGHGGP